MQTGREGREGWGVDSRVAIVHSRYSSAQSSGENAAVDRQVAALQRARISVLLVEQETDQRSKSPLYPAEAAISVATGRGRSPLARLEQFAPHVVHVHNLFPNFGRSWVRRLNIPLVATMHNFRPLCPAATFYRDGHICTDCLDHSSARPSVQHGCYRGSRLKTLPLALSTTFADDAVLRRADRLIVLNPTMANLYNQAGVSRDKLALLPNFLPDPGTPGPGGGPWLFVGRLSPEKGALDLVEQWPAGLPLIVVGDGPDRGRIENAAPPGVQVMGDQPAEVVRALMSKATGLLFPSRWFEGSPLVYLEALAAGTPVLAWHPSSIADTVLRDGTGIVVNNLAEALGEAHLRFPGLRGLCRRAFDSRYAEQRHVEALKEVYTAAIEAHRYAADLS